MYHKILVPLDGTVVQDQVLKHASALARNEGAELVLLRVLHDSSARGLFNPPWAQAAPAQDLDAASLVARSSLERRAQTLRRSNLKVSVHVASGTPAEAIVSAACSLGADAIVMSAYGIKARAAWLDGDVTTQVLRGSGVPVFLVGGGKAAWDAPDSPETAPGPG